MTNVNVIKSVVPAITSSIFRAKEAQNYMEPQTCAIAGLAIFHMMTSFTRDDVVPAVAMVALAESAIHKANSSNNDIKQFHYVDPAVNLVGLSKHLGFLSISEDKSFTMTERWIELVSTKETCVPLTSKVDDTNRRKPYIKGGKAKPSNLMTTCVDFLQSTEYHVDQKMVAIVDAVVHNSHVVPATIQQELHVWNAAKQYAREDVLFSDYFADNRGRLYHVACAGPNPQSSDFARSLYSHNVENFVAKDSAAYQMFMAELNDIAGGTWCEAKTLTFVAQNPARSLNKMLTTGNAPKKPFTYIRLALDWFEFETTGQCDSRVGFGLDAKCSGTQYLAFIAGNMEMARATGLVDSDTKAADPYQLSLVELMKGLERTSFNPEQHIKDACLNKKDGRNFIKTPYMAVQYGGGVAALTGNKEFTTTAALIVGEEKVADFAKTCVEAIHSALGEKINMFIEKVQQAVMARLIETGKEFLDYKHSDGQRVHKPCYPSRDVCDAFSIRVDSQTRVIFGQQVENKPWTIRETAPTKEEFVRTFVVNFIQGIDALVARTVAKYAKKAGLRGFTSIHDCFRCCLADAPKMMDVIRQAYVEIFVHNNQFENLAKQIGGIDMYHTNIVTEELLMSEHAYYFCQ